ncbi:MAG: hypothetical protein J0H52_05785, partial [Comamonadaceae bacterium]|nr:hypothetical protein [Comamonadaceae bacterium]
SGLNTAVVGSLLFTVPPVAEQELIIGQVEKDTEPVQLTIKLVERTISMLQEQRSALITAAVTGQIQELQ